jgi:hypothetical protein
MFFVSAPKRTIKRKTGRQAQDIARGGGDDAGGKNYDDVAKVGVADRGDFRPDGQAHEDNARFGPSFQLQAAWQSFR